MATTNDRDVRDLRDPAAADAGVAAAHRQRVRVDGESGVVTLLDATP
jgi:hypothetical protein